MPIGLSAYSYSRLIQAGQMSLVQTPDRTRELGFDQIEFIDLPGDDEATRLSMAGQLREACGQAGLPIVNYAVGADFLHAPGGLAAEVERVKGCVRVAAALGAAHMRHDATRGFARDAHRPRSFASVLPELVKACLAVTQYAADLGIRTLVENHGYFCQDSERLEQLADAVGHPNFGLLADIGNFICVDEDPPAALGRLMPFVRHVHVKDFHRKPGTRPGPGEGWYASRGGNYWRGSIIGHGDVPVAQCLRVIRQAGYDGSFAIEYEGMEDPLTGIRIGRDNLRRLMPA